LPLDLAHASLKLADLTQGLIQNGRQGIGAPPTPPVPSGAVGAPIPFASNLSMLREPPRPYSTCDRAGVSPLIGTRGDSVVVYLKNVSDGSRTIDPQPNHTRHQWAPWDAFVFVADPDGLAREFESRGVKFWQDLRDRDDGLRGFEIRDSDGCVLFFGRPS
jgi:hypothetical protein